MAKTAKVVRPEQGNENYEFSSDSNAEQNSDIKKEVTHRTKEIQKREENKNYVRFKVVSSSTENKIKINKDLFSKKENSKTYTDKLTEYYDRLISEYGLSINKNQQYILLIHAYILSSLKLKSISDNCNLIPHIFENDSQNNTWEFTYSKNLSNPSDLTDSNFMDKNKETVNQNVPKKHNICDIVCTISETGILEIQEKYNYPQIIRFYAYELLEINLNDVTLSKLPERFKEKMDLLLIILTEG
jgi:hypothetical protein